MSRYRPAIFTLLALGASFPGIAATVFWPFGFDFPDKARRHTGGLVAAVGPMHSAPAGAISISGQRELQVALLTDIELKAVDELNDAQEIASSVADRAAGRYTEN